MVVRNFAWPHMLRVFVLDGLDYSIPLEGNHNNVLVGRLINSNLGQRKSCCATHIYTHVYIHIYTCIYLHASIRTYMCVCVCMCVCVHIYICMYVYVYVYVYLYMYMYTYILAYLQV